MPARRRKIIIWARRRLAVEIVSERNSADEIAGKIELYLLHGAAEVWVLYPKQRQMWLYTGGDRGTRYSGTLASSLLPGASIDLNQPFE